MSRHIKFRDPEIHQRKSFSLICVRQASDRSSEIAWILLDSLQWDPCYQQVFAELPQHKVSKTKLFAMVAGSTRHSCFFTSMGDLLTLCPSVFYVPEEDKPHWLFPWLKELAQPGTKLGRMLKACHSSQVKRTKLRVTKSLSIDATAQGIIRGRSISWLQRCLVNLP